MHLRVAFYCGRYDQRMLGIFPVGNPMLAIPENQADVAVLEEPEHLTWFQHGPRWTTRFNHVVRNTVLECLMKAPFVQHSSWSDVEFVEPIV